MRDPGTVAAILNEIKGKVLGHNHDLTYLFAYQDVFARHADCVGFLDLGNRFQTFEKDALLLEREFDVLISRITPKDDPDWPVPACQLSLWYASIVIPKLIQKGYKVLFAEQIKETAQKTLFEMEK